MAVSTTSIYQWMYLTPYLSTGAVLTGDQQRFQSIEAELFALYSIFGNGILDNNPSIPAWNILAGSNSPPFTILVTPGQGFVSFMSAITTVTKTVSLPFPATGFPCRYWIYAVINSNTPVTQDVDFVISAVQISDVNNYVGLGAVDINQVTSGYTLTIYNDAAHGRVNISIFSTIESAINAHVHTGGANEPSKINLQYHVQGQLSGDNIQNLDLGVVSSGFLDPNRLPITSHTDLTDIGTLSHPQIDSLIGLMSTSPGSLLSDLTTDNMIRLYLSVLRRSVLSGGSALYGVTQNADNTILYVPGVDTYINDFATDFSSLGSAAAEIDYANHRIVGTNANTGSLSGSITWTTDTDFTAAVDNTASILDIPTSSIALAEYNGPGIDTSIGLTVPLLYSSVVGTSGSDNICDMTSWTSGTVLSNTSSGGPTGFQDTLTLTSYLYNEFGPDDWSQRQKIALCYQLMNNTVEIPGTIEAFLIMPTGIGTSVTVTLPSGSESTPFYISDVVTLYNPSDFTSTPGTPQYVQYGLSQFFNDISISNLTGVSGIGFRWSNTTGWNSLLTTDFALVSPIGSINTFILNSNSGNPTVANLLNTAHQNDSASSAVFVWNETNFVSSQSLYFRFNSNYDSTAFNNIVVDTTLATGTSISFSTRCANTTSVLNSLNFQNITISSGTGNIPTANNANIGKYIDILVTFTSPNQQGTPLLNSLTINYSNPANAEFAKIWDTLNTPNPLNTEEPGETGWNTATSMTNISVVDSSILNSDISADYYYLQLNDTSKVGQWVYAQGGNLEIIGHTNNVIDGGTLYTTPMQRWLNNGIVGFGNFNTGIRDIISLSNGHYIVVDTDNDRIIELDSSYQFVRAIQGNLQARSTASSGSPIFAILGAYYNPRLATMWIACSQNIASTYATSQIFIGTAGGSTAIPLTTTGITVSYFNPNTLTDSTYPTLQVNFSGAALTQISTWSGSLVVIFQPNSISQDGSSAFPITEGTGIAAPTYTSSTSGASVPVGPSNQSTMPSSIVGLYNITSLTSSTVGGEMYYSNGLQPTVTTTTINYGGYIPSSTNAVIVPVWSGEIVFDDIYQPISAQMTVDNILVVASVGGATTVNAYDSLSNKVWSLPSTAAVFTRNTTGGAWYGGDANGIITLALPDTTGAGIGYVQQYNRLVGNIIVNNIPILNGNVVRAIPDISANGYFWVLVDDVQNGGNASSLLYINSLGIVSKKWPAAVDGVSLVHPTGFSVLNNGQIIVSD